MDPINNNQIPAMELPDISPEKSGNNPVNSGESVPVTEDASAKALEQGLSTAGPQPATDEHFDTNLGPQPAVALFTYDDPVLPVPQTPSSQNPLIADDSDLIEKEWVEKAKRIVEQTSTDPRKQNTEINKVKADYIKKRYNREVKVQEE
jgi:hypothetical protein